ncbi:Prenyltransferase and squalene oxidase repeat protein [Planctomycetes bacterium Pan216]|uniref:Prenyltransferase and squalene oxidase repeat protein n=1 Tax=Kolteria novifilia TaxID=2527975 RepID=A0A518AZ99_9BACT|nr:Prenyltransferase and squalene oxidase repeat protein [Planctomycetes bacterium Pan216]
MKVANMVVLAALLFLTTASVAQDADPPEAKEELVAAGDDLILVTPNTQRSINAGLEYLVRRQNPQGSIGSGQYADNIAVSALSGLALLSSGSTPGEGPYGKPLDRLVDFILDNTSPSGFICVPRSTSHGPMYDHGFGTLFLAEVYGMTRRADIREKLKKAIQLIIFSQNNQGGWRYQPQRTPDADISVSVCQIMALRAARNAGIHVPRSTIDKCVEYVRRSQNGDGGFRYMINAGPSAFPRSAAGIVALYSTGIYEGNEIEHGLEYLMQYIPGRQNRRESHYFYGHYYAVQAMYQSGDDHWLVWYPAIRDELNRRSRPDGSWADTICPEYGTAMACIILQMPNGYLPIFQR